MDALEIAAALADLRVGVELDRHCCPDADAKLSALDAAILAALEDPIWEDGEPANLLAAGQDAYAWLSWLQQHARAFLMKPEDQVRLERCMVVLNSFLRPNAYSAAALRHSAECSNKEAAWGIGKILPGLNGLDDGGGDGATAGCRCYAAGKSPYGIHLPIFRCNGSAFSALAG